MAALTGRQKPEKVENVLMGEWFADAAKTNFSRVEAFLEILFLTINTCLMDSEKKLLTSRQIKR
jgi:hypothetical protein